MAETGKKVEVRYGAFACRVEGFDDPVATLRDVISLMQRMIAETPAMADRHAALDDALVARIGDALAGRRATEDATPGIVVIRNDEAVAADREGEVEEAEILAPRRQEAADATPWHPVAGRPPTGGPVGGAEDRRAPDPAPADAGPHPSAALYAAPAAAAAEAAFAASVAAATELPGDETDSQDPLGVGEPEDAATSAALFAAPAAAVADAAFASGRTSPAPADAAGGDAERPRAHGAAANSELPWVDAAAGDPEPPGTDAAAGDLEAPWDDAAAGDAEPPWADAAEARPGRAGPEIVASSDADQAGAAPEALRRGRAPGGPGEGWAPWGSGPAAAGAANGAGTPSPTVSSDADRASGGQERILPQGFRDPAPHYDEAEEDLIPGFNIFAPPPSPDPAIAGSPGAFPAGAGGTAAPVPIGRGSGPPVAAPGPGAGPGAPLAPARELAEGSEPAPALSAGGSAEDAADDFTDRSADASDEALDDGAGDGLDAADDGVHDPDDDTDAHRSAENRLAALITRYQSGQHGAAAREPAPDRAAGAISATELAERAGATEVDTLLAASAAWLTLADGRARFTRREVMEVFETLPGDHPRTLEARIKGFGTLVRSGALQLVDDGAFSLAPRERARFRAMIDQG